jgi:hypothetical protein
MFLYYERSGKEEETPRSKAAGNPGLELFHCTRRHSLYLPAVYLAFIKINSSKRTGAIGKSRYRLDFAPMHLLYPGLQD